MDRLMPYEVAKLEGEALRGVLDAWRIATGDDDMPTYLTSAVFEVEETGEEWLIHSFYESTEGQDEGYPLTPKDFEIGGIYVTDSRMSPVNAEKPYLSNQWGDAIYSDPSDD